VQLAEEDRGDNFKVGGKGASAGTDNFRLFAVARRGE
jgi:hypothetical protein